MTGASSRSMVKYESGYNIETVFDGSKLGIEPYAIKVSPNGGELIVLDSENSNIHKISMPLSRCKFHPLLEIDQMKKEILRLISLDTYTNYTL